MPEIAEIARAVHFLKLHLVGKGIKSVVAADDANVFGKAGTTGPAFVSALTGRKVVSAGQQGKYFWLEFDKAPHAILHFGMTGWIHIRNEKTAYTNYEKKMKDEDVDMWPPKYWKFHLETEGVPSVQVAFTDPRRFGRIRLVDCPGKSIREHSPLVENGPDPLESRFTEEYLGDKMRSRHVPVKAFILDQAMISGIGNWVGDEVLYHSRLHPEQYCDSFSDEQIHSLFEAIRYVCTLAVEKLGDSDQFPAHWLFNYRWGKGKKDESKRLPNGDRLTFLTVGGRTSCFAPDVQKKTGQVASGVKEEAKEPGEPGEFKSKTKERKTAVSAKPEAVKQRTTTMGETQADEKKPVPRRKRSTNSADDQVSKTRKKKKTERSPSKAASLADGDADEVFEGGAPPGRRRSGRLRAKSSHFEA